jgi:uncharacterized BrkB/YihY/UPF0761 family membrane protein
MYLRTGQDFTSMSVYDFALKGKHNQYNTMAASLAASSMDIRKEKIREAVMQRRGTLGVRRPELEYAGVVKIVERASAANASDRYASVVELADALAAIYSRAPAERRPVPRRLYVLIGSMILLALIILGVAAYVLVQVLRP